VEAYHPGGGAGWGAPPLDVTTREMARDALAVLDALRVRRARVFGISLGAMVSTWLAVDAPDRVSRLCLASAGVVGFALTPSGLVHGAEMAASVLAPEGEVVRRLADALISPETRADDPARVEAIDAAADAEPARRLELVKHAMAAVRHDARAALPSITAPTLVLAGARDVLIGTAPPRSLAEAIHGARFEVIEDAGHDLTLEQPAETARRVAAFFRARRR
jgi:3-oxoadipate enol-lactonase